MTAEEVMARYGISKAAWEAMAVATLTVRDVTGEVVGLAVRATPEIFEEDDRFFYDVDWLKWLEVTYPGRSVVGSMAPVDQDTQDAFVWFVALD